MRCKWSNHISLRNSSCLSGSSFGTIFAQTFLMFNSSLRIRRTLSLTKLISSATALKPNLRDFRITSRTFSIFSSVTAVSIWMAWAINFHAFSAFQTEFVPIKHACMRHKSSLKASVNNWKTSFADFFSLTRNLM